MKKEEKKRFVIPEAEILNFLNDDIITTSLADGGDGGSIWDPDDSL